MDIRRENMGKAKPCLGYSSRTACALALQAKGIHYKEIARQIGIKDSTVAALLSGAKRKRPSVDHQRTVCIDSDVLDALRPAAARRGISVNNLCRQLIGCIADDDLADAILDDALEIAQ
jgi:transcriptional regulator with XRE-family HTH domain